ncbi:hypothetical protein LWI28_026750 [Acer negundo]|uniref:Uncharacterized protein n=1 Tax=Acer negundo TaxID=4023 RepID=A0AAD5J6E8_ACENE|nr:hypothetical protein LWI28_026750 [Acer negundo]
MMFGRNLLFLALAVTTTYMGTAMAKNTYIIHMDKTKMAANLFQQGDSMQTYQAVIDSINEMSLQEDDEDQQEETMAAELLYAYETAISGFSAKLSTKQLQSLEIASAAKFCLNGTLNETLVKGKIVVCHSDSRSAYLKSEHVKKAKGVGMILINSEVDGDEITAQPYQLPTVRLGATTGHVDPERAVDPGLIYDIAAEDYLKYICSLNYTSAEKAIISGGNLTCPKNGAIRGGELNYPSFAFNFRDGVQNGSLEYKRTVTNVGIPISSYAVQVEVPKGASVIVKPKILSFNKLGQKLSYKVTVVGKSKTSSDSSFGSLTWVSGKFRVRSPIAVTWQ